MSARMVAGRRELLMQGGLTLGGLLIEGALAFYAGGQPAFFHYGGAQEVGLRGAI